MKTYAHLSDEVLVDLVRNADERAFATLYDRYWAMLYQHARRMLQNEEEAEDVVQETFVIFYNKAATLQLSGNFSGYLYATVRNRILNYFNRNKVKHKYMLSLKHYEENVASFADYDIREKQLVELIEQEIATLPVAQRKAFELSRNAHLSYKEIAEQLGTSEHAVRNNLSRAIRSLKIKLGDIVMLFLKLILFFKLF